VAVVLGLACSLCWGTADFFGGLQSRHLPVLAVALWSQLAGLAALVLVALVSGQHPATAGLAWGAGAGLFGAAALALLYRALAIGVMSLVAPVSACGAVVPVVVSLALGHRPGVAALAGMVAALAGVVLISSQGPAADHAAHVSRSTLGLALGAALGFGCFYVFLNQGAAAAGGAILWTTVAARVSSLGMLLIMIVAGPRTLPWPGRRGPIVAMVGVLDSTANVFFAAATSYGDLAVVSVLASLYPAATVLLGRLVLAERLRAAQGAGVLLALAGVMLISAG
jgi:drug/metabolite transporter (DMT)-like permease